jgi:hypothetical protein
MRIISTPQLTNLRDKRMRYFIRWAPIASVVSGLVFAAGSGLAQDTLSLHSQSASQRDVKQIERVAIRIVHADLSRRGVDDWNNVGFDPDADAHFHVAHGRRDSVHAQDLLTELGGRRISIDSMQLNAANCKVGTLRELVYLNRPVIRGDSATVEVTFAFKGMQACRFFSEFKTFAFFRREGDWMYVGVQGKTLST